MANNEQFQASVVAGIETPGSAEAAKIFAQLLSLTDQLTGSAKTAGSNLVQAFTAGKKPEELSSQIRILQRELKNLSTLDKGTALFKSDEVTKVNDINRAIAAAAKAYDAMKQSAAMSRYELGLDSKTASEAASNLKILETNLKAVDLALSKDAGNKALQQKKQLLTDNHALLNIVIDDMKKQAAQEKENEKITAANAAAAKARISEIQKIEQKRREQEGSASAQTRNGNTILDYSQRGRDYASNQFDLKNTRIDSSLLPGKQDIAMSNVLAQSARQYLGQAYKDAGLVRSSLSATITDGPRVRQIMGEIRDIEAKIVADRAAGNVNLANELKLLEQIRLKAMSATNVRRDDAANNPENRQARLDTQSRNMLNRAGGEGGAALLAVQASLMANYSILGSTVSAAKAAITTSVELEAAFRNVQAVTATTKTEMGGLESKIKDVAASSKFTSLEVANAALILGQAGLSARQVGEALQPVVMLASAAGTTISQAVDLVTSIIGVFESKNVSDIADIANKVTQASNSSKISVEKLALGFQYVGNAAAQVGITFEETTAALAAMSNAGIKNGSTMGTGLRQFLTETEKPSKEFLQTLQRLGLSLADIDFKSNGLIGVTQKLREAGFVASDAIKSFDVRGAAAFNALIADPAGLERQYRLLQDSQAGLEANAVQMDSLKSQSARLTTSLGNLASTGFEPLSRILARIAGGFASVIQFVSEHNVVVGAAGTALTALLATGAVSYLANMAAGALRLAAGAGAASVALTTLQTASKAGSLYVLTASIASSVSAIGSLTAAAVPATAATTTLSAAVTRLTVAFAGMSIVTGIGIAIAAVTAAYFAFEYATGRASAEIDKLKASTNNSKGAFEEKDAAVKALTKKIEDLTYREESLRANTQNVTTESLALNSQFGSMGLVIDSNNKSFDTMITKLRALKVEMMAIRKQSLETALAENQTLLQKQMEKAKKDQEEVAGTNGYGRNNARELAKFAQNAPGLSASERLKLSSASQQLATGDMTNMGDISGAALLMQKVMSKMQSGGADAQSMMGIRKMTDALLVVGKNLTELNQTRASIAQQEGQLNRDAAYEAFNASGKFGVQGGKPRTFEEALPKQGNLEVMALAAAGTPGEKDPIKIFEAVKKEQDKRAAIYEKFLNQIKDSRTSGAITEEVADIAIQKINAQKEKEKNALIATAQATEDQATLAYGRQRRLLMSRQKNAKINGDKEAQAKLETELGELEIAFKNRAETSQARALNTAEELRAIREQNKENIYDKKGRATRVVTVNDNMIERSLRVQADAADSSANESKNAIKTAQTMEEVSKLMDEAIEAKFDAKKKRLEALAAKQKAEAKQPGYDPKIGNMAHKLETQALIESEDSKINSFADSFISLIESAMGRLDKVTKRINESKRRISEEKLDSEDRIFESQQALRETELAIALGKKIKSNSKSTVTYGKESSGLTDNVTYNSKGEAKVRTSFSASKNYTTFGPNGVSVNNVGTGSSKTTVNDGNESTGLTAAGVSSAIRETLNQRRNRLIVESTKIELEENEKQLAEYGDNTTGLIGDMSEKYRLAKEQVKILRDKLASETDEAIRAGLQARLNNAEGDVTKSFTDLRGARSEKQKLQVENFNIQKRRAENTEVLPQEVSIDSLMNKLDEVWGKYQDTVGKMDVVKTVSEGLSGVLGSVTGSLGNAFSAIVTGTKSVKGAFQDMAAGIIKAMIDILSQALAMQAVKSLIGLTGLGGGAGTAAAGSSFIDMIGQALPFALASGGAIIPGGVQRSPRMMAEGGNVTGGVANKDSVPTMLMPGEFVMKKSAVEAVGTDYLHSLNSAVDSVVSSSQAKAPAAEKQGAPTEVNVWVVTEDQKPAGLGPNDIVTVVSDNIERGGSIKKLIKRISTGQG